MRCDGNDARGFCWRNPPQKNSLFSVKSQTPPTTSNVQRPRGFDSPTSGLKAQRFVLRLTNLLGSYCPVGATTVQLAPSNVRGLKVLNSLGFSAGPPSRVVANRRRTSPKPERVTSCCSSKTVPLALPRT